MDRRKFITGSAVSTAALATMSCSSVAPIGGNSEVSLLNDTSLDFLSLDERKRWLASYSCNIEQWFRPMPFLDRIDAAKALGFSAVELWDPYNAALGKSPTTIAKRAKEQGIKITSYSPKAIHIGDPENHKYLNQWLDQTIAAGHELGVNNFNFTGHKLIPQMSVEAMIENYTNALQSIVPRLESEGMVATIEPYNPSSHKGHFIYGNEPALSICREINSPSIKLNWDFFHMQRTNGNLITNLEQGFDQVAYIQFADSPGRNQPGTGEVAYGNVFSRLRELGYSGYIGAEFFPMDKDPLRAAMAIANLAKHINLTEPSSTL
ncbi:MAG: TIM barrel protein [Glaciecola sp.]|jgi:hydroxypyruvate isomerase